MLIDSDASTHVFKNQSYFTFLENNFNPKRVSIVLADGTVCREVKGKGNVTFTLISSVLGDQLPQKTYIGYLLSTMKTLYLSIYILS